MNGACMLLLLAQAAPAAPAGTPSPAAAASPAEWTGPIVVLDTSLGAIKIGLDREKAPLSVDNFLKYVRAGFYSGTIFHRVMADFMIQGGGLDKNLVEKMVLAPIRNEAKNGLRNARGSIAMARTTDPHSATAQFFINLKDNPLLDYGIRGAGYAVFGQVLEGMDVVDKIAAVAITAKGPHESVPITPVMINSARALGAASAPAKPAPSSAKPAPASAKPAASRAKPSPSPKQ